MAALADNIRLSALYAANASQADKALGLTAVGKDELIALHEQLFMQNFSNGFTGPANTAANVTVGNLRAFLNKLAGEHKQTWDFYVDSKDRDVNPFLLSVWLKVANLNPKLLSLTRHNNSSSSSSSSDGKSVSLSGGISSIHVAGQFAVPTADLSEDEWQQINGTALNELHRIDPSRDNDQCPKSTLEVQAALRAVRELILQNMSGQITAAKNRAWVTLMTAIEEAAAVFQEFRMARNDFTVKALTDKHKSVLGYGSFANLAPAIKLWYNQPSIQKSLSSFFDVPKNKHNRTFMWFVHAAWIFGRFHSSANDPNLAKMKSLLRVYAVRIKPSSESSKELRDAKRQKLRQDDVDNQACFHCHERGHKAHECPTRGTN